MVSKYSKNYVDLDDWESDYSHHIEFIAQKQDEANRLLREKGIVYLNEVYDMLGMKKTKAGEIVGWDINGRNGDGYIAFDIHRVKNRTIELDFNVDGAIKKETE